MLSRRFPSSCLRAHFMTFFGPHICSKNVFFLNMLPFFVFRKALLLLIDIQMMILTFQRTLPKNVMCDDIPRYILVVLHFFYGMWRNRFKPTEVTVPRRPKEKRIVENEKKRREDKEENFVKLIIKQLFRLNLMCTLFKRDRSASNQKHMMHLSMCSNAGHMLSFSSEHTLRFKMMSRLKNILKQIRLFAFHMQYIFSHCFFFF